MRTDGDSSELHHHHSRISIHIIFCVDVDSGIFSKDTTSPFQLTHTCSIHSPDRVRLSLARWTTYSSKGTRSASGADTFIVVSAQEKRTVVVV